MLWLYAVIFSMAFGIALGYAAERLPVSPVIQSVTAASIAVLLGAVSTAVIWFRMQRGVAAVAVVADAAGLLFWTAAFCVTCVAMYLVASRISGVAGHRAVVLGIVGGLCGVLLIARMVSPAG